MISEETLTLYFYDDGLSETERREVDAALRADAELAERYATLRRQLEGLADADDVKAPAHLLQRWHDSIDSAAAKEAAAATRPRQSFHLMSFAWGGALAAAMALAVGLWFSGEGGDESPVQVEPVVDVMEPAGALAVPVSFTRGLRVHLEDSQAGLSQLDSGSDEDRQQLLMEIIRQNRAFELAAEGNNAADVARLLRAFELVLMQLAMEDASSEDAAAMHAQLMFELNVMLTKLANPASDDEQTI